MRESNTAKVIPVALFHATHSNIHSTASYNYLIMLAMQPLSVNHITSTSRLRQVTLTMRFVVRAYSPNTEYQVHIIFKSCVTVSPRRACAMYNESKDFRRYELKYINSLISQETEINISPPQDLYNRPSKLNIPLKLCVYAITDFQLTQVISG